MIYTVSQDGADFYLTNEADDLVCVITYPAGVPDFDLEAAQRARAWFERLMAGWKLVHQYHWAK